MDVPPKPPRIAVDPDLPLDVQNLLVEWETAEFKVSGLRELGRPPTGRSERPRPLVTRRFLATAGGTTAAVVALTVTLGWGLVAFLILMLVPIGAGGVVFLADLSRRYNAERYRLLRSAYDQYVLPEDLNEPARDMLARTQRAVDSVRLSPVNQEGLLDHVGNRVVLPGLEWEIAAALHRVSRLRADQPDGAEGPVSDAAAGIERRVAALEAYAEQVKAADAAYAVAPLEAQQPAADLDGLTVQARAATEALHETVQRVTDAAEQLPQNG
jgi:hypothetical protein